MTRVFVNGEEVRKEDLEKMTIECEMLNQIIAEKASCTEKAS